MAKYPQSVTVRMGGGLYHQIQAIEKRNGHNLNQSQVIRALLCSAANDYEHGTIEDIDLIGITKELQES